MLNLLLSAKNDERNENHTFFLSGDLSQMSAQSKFLTLSGFDIKQNNVYPSLKQEDVARALKLIWGHKVEGWWHYKDEYVKYDICTNEQFKNSLKSA